MAIPVSEFDPPSLEQLEAQALEYYKTCKPKAYKQMKKDGDLKEVCQMKAEAAKRYAENLIATGESARRLSGKGAFSQ